LACGHTSFFTSASSLSQSLAGFLFDVGYFTFSSAVHTRNLAKQQRKDKQYLKPNRESVMESTMKRNQIKTFWNNHSFNNLWLWIELKLLPLHTVSLGELDFNLSTQGVVTALCWNNLHSHAQY